jgi:hypothetical protein
LWIPSILYKSIHYEYSNDTRKGGIDQDNTLDIKAFTASKNESSSKSLLEATQGNNNSLASLSIDATKYTPEINFQSCGSLKIRGRSLPNNPEEFFSVMDDWITQYIINPAEITCLDLVFETISADSCKYVYFIIQKIKYIGYKDKKFSINWYYEDGFDDILKIGEDFSSALDIPFNFICIKPKSEKKNDGLISKQEQPVKPVMSNWERMEHESEDRLAKYSQERLKEMRDRWVASSEEDETETEV